MGYQRNILGKEKESPIQNKFDIWFCLPPLIVIKFLQSWTCTLYHLLEFLKSIYIVSQNLAAIIWIKSGKPALW